MSDQYFTIAKAGEGKITEKMSRFLAFAYHIESAEEAREMVKLYQNEYHDARHVCWAYMVGADMKEWQLNDNGEPSGTAGKPILGQIRSQGVTDVVVIVVRYFGGIKLGTPGLIAAYREAARLALEDAGRKEMFKTADVAVSFPYVAADGVMKIVKGSSDVEVTERSFDNVCRLALRCRESDAPQLLQRLSKVDGASAELMGAETSK